MKKAFRKQDWMLICLSILLILSVREIEKAKILEKDPWYRQKIESAQIMERAMEVVREDRIRRDLPIDLEHDFNGTGMIGMELSPITTTLGSLESKRTSTNPNFAAVVVDMLKELKIEKGDEVAVNFSSSFPALNIAVLSAIESLELRPVIISSIGASTWGGNIPSFTYMDMEQLLYEKDILSHTSMAVSIGGASDVGKDMDKNRVNEILERARNHHKKILYQPDLQRNIQERYRLYTQEAKEIRVFINVGGNMVSMGKGIVDIEPGILTSYSGTDTRVEGLIQLFLAHGTPVIHLLDIKKMATDYGLPIDPYPLPKVGEGMVYYQEKYPLIWIIAILSMTVCGLLYYRIGARDKYDW